MSTFASTVSAKNSGGGVPGTFYFTKQPNNVSGSRTGYGLVLSNPSSVTVVGGVPPYTYAWEFVSGDSSVLPESPTSNVSRFTAFADGIPFSTSATYRSKVTDSAATAITSSTFTIDLQSTSL